VDEENGSARGCEELWEEVEVSWSLGNVEVGEDNVDGSSVN